MNLTKLLLFALFIVVVSSLNLNCSKDENPVEPTNNLPVVTIVTPVNNTTYFAGDTILFSGTATDQEDGTLTDSSLVWVSDIDGQIGIGSTLKVNSLSENNHIIVITASDSKGDTGVDTVTVTIQANIPIVTITSPVDSSIFSFGDSITFTGTAVDKEDGVLHDSSLVWTSDIDGQIGVGSAFTLNNLSNNTHVITLTATDLDGNNNAKHIKLNIDITFSKTFGGNQEDRGLSACTSLDGSIVIVGFTESFGAGGTDVYLVKTDSTGNLVWEKTFGGIYDDKGYSIYATSDNGYIIAGATKSFGAGSDDVYLIKTDNSGNLTWEKTFGGMESDYGYSVVETSNNNFLITGYTRSFGAGSYDLLLIKTDFNGDSLWIKSFGGIDNDIGTSICETSDSNYIITGFTKSFGYGMEDVYLIKTNSDGDSLWTKTFGGSGKDFGASISEVSDGGYLIAGKSEVVIDGYAGSYLVKTDIFGNIIWQKTYYGDSGEQVIESSQGGYIIIGNRVNHIYLFKTDSFGNLVWDIDFTNPNAYFSQGYSILETIDHGFAIVGNLALYDNMNYVIKAPKVYLIKTDSKGNVY